MNEKNGGVRVKREHHVKRNTNIMYTNEQTHAYIRVYNIEYAVYLCI